MTAIFPLNPENGERYTVPGGVTFQWVSPPGGWVQVGQWSWPPAIIPGQYVEFPQNPKPGDTYVTPSGITFILTDKYAWRVQGSNILPSPWFLAGVGEPPNIVGFAGNYYLDLATGNLWGPYNNGVWPYPPVPFVPTQGNPGPVGPQGPQGPQGIQGVPGATGSQGPVGSSGSIGATGDQGPQGIQGIQGPAGWTTKVFGSFTNNAPSSLPLNGFFPANWDSSGNPPVDTVIPNGGSLIYTVNSHLWMFVGTAFSSTGWADIGPVQGPQGPQGIQGIVGPAGVAGSAGPGGIAGPQGTQGAQGPQGPIGPTGPGGVQGNQGVMGAKGSQGLAGPTGPVGPLGPVGPAGPSVEIIGEFTNKAPSTLPSNGHIPANWDSAGQPPADLYVLDGQGLVYTPTGHVWLYVTADFTPAGWIDIGAMQGPQGVTGPQGIVGPVGAAGAQGIQGPPGVQGPQGPGGGVGIAGPPGATGPAGVQGPIGPQGPQGDQGIPGPPGGLGEAPNDGQFYGRQNLAWAAFPIQDAPSDSNSYVRNNAGWIKDPIQSDAPNDGKMYGRSSALWSRAVAVAGDTMVGNLSMSNHSITNVSDPVNPQDSATKNYVDVRGGSVTISDTPPVTTVPGNLWWDSVGGNMYIWYNDGTSSQWVVSVNIAGAYVPVGGGTMTGALDIKVSGTPPTATALVVQSNATATTAQLMVSGVTNPNQQLMIGYDTVNDVGYIQSIKQGTAFEPLNLNPSGGHVTVGGGVSIGNPTFNASDPGQGVLAVQNEIQVNTTSGVLPSPIAGTLLQAGAASGVNSRIELEANAGVPLFTGRRSDGTWGSPTALAATDPMLQIGALGYDGSAYTTAANAYINFFTQNAWTPTDHSTWFQFCTTPSGSVTPAEVARVQASGGVTIGNVTFNNIDPGQGVIAAQNGVQLPPTAPVHDNRVINGGFDVWQLGTNFSLANGSVAYTADQWMAVNNLGAGVTLNIGKGSATGLASYNYIQGTANSATAGGNCGFICSFEAAQIADLDGQPVTVSFYMNSSVSAGSLGGSFQVQGNTAPDNGSWSVAIASASFTPPTALARVVISLTAAQTVGFKNGARLLFYVVANANCNITYVNMLAVKMERGSIAQPYVPKGIAREILDCERYLQKSYDLTVVPGATSTNPSFMTMTQGTSNYPSLPVYFRTRMRVAPTVTLRSPSSGAVGMMYNYTANNDVAAALMYNITTQTGCTPGINNVSTAAGTALGVQWVADARL